MDRQTRQAIKHDKFLEELSHAYTFASDNRRKLILAVAVIAVIAVAVSGLAWYFRGQEAEAQQLLADGIEIMSTPAGTEAGGTTYDTDEARLEAAEEIFRQVIDEYGSRDAADIAAIHVAQIEATRGEYDAARAKFETFIEDHPDHILSGAVRMSLVNLQLASGQVDEVITDLQARIAAEEEALPRPALLALLAQAYEIKGDQDNAMQAYRRIATEYPDSPYSLDANRKLAQG